jgi:hypothetical protein
VIKEMANQKTTLKDASAKEAKAKDAALENAVTHIKKEFGDGALMRLGADSTVQVGAIPTGSLALDLALGIGGVPRGRIVEIFGPESSGKTTLIYHIIAEAQSRGGVCVFIDTEHAMDPIYAKAIGVDTDELLVSQPDYGEQALQIADRLISSAAIDVVAIDSVAALTPKAELEGQIGDTTVGLQARLMSQAMRKLAGNLNRTNTGGLKPSRRGPRRSATGSGSKSSRTKSRRPSGRRSSTSSTGRASLAREACSTSESSTAWSRSRGPSSPTGRRGSDKAATTPSSS